MAVQELAVAEFPDSGTARHHLILLLNHLGRTGEAHRALFELVDRLESFPDLSPDDRQALRDEAGFLRRHEAAMAGP